MNKLKYVAYCGLYCKLCAHIARIPRQASVLQDTLDKGGWQYFGQGVFPEFREFWKVLGQFSQMDKTCPACRGGCGYPLCPIRKCARERKLDACSSCSDFPCQHVSNLAQKYPNLIADAMRQRQIGMDQWIEEQEERYKSGFCYHDIKRS